LKWLISLRDPTERLARWMVEVKQFIFAVEYAALGDGSLMEVPGENYRDTMDKDILLCHRFLRD
jgi:hypothetical protein